MLLANPSDLLDRMGLGNTVVGNAESATSALKGGTSIVENLLDTTFDEAERKDYFSYHPSRFKNDFDPLTFYLTAGFVKSAQPFAVYFASQKASIEDVADGELIDPENYTVEYDSGRVILNTEPPRGYRTVLIHYQHGFSVTSEVYQNVPGWLREIGITAGLRVSVTSSAFTNKQEYNFSAPELHRILMYQANEHRRPRYGVIFPILSVKV